MSTDRPAPAGLPRYLATSAYLAKPTTRLRLRRPPELPDMEPQEPQDSTPIPTEPLIDRRGQHLGWVWWTKGNKPVLLTRAGNVSVDRKPHDRFNPSANHGKRLDCLPL